jgi:hypothetical protein
MKTAEEVADRLESLLGERVLLLCGVYLYDGILEAVNEMCVRLSSPRIVYQTGSWDAKEYEDAQALPTQSAYVMVAAIESFFPKSS